MVVPWRRVVCALLGAAATVLTAVPSTGGVVAAVPKAHCGPGSSPETGLQGQVPRRDRESGRSALGYRCNLELVGRYQGQGASWVSPSTGSSRLQR
jgi:hypothetical protein